MPPTKSLVDQIMLELALYADPAIIVVELGYVCTDYTLILGSSGITQTNYRAVFTCIKSRFILFIRTIRIM
jgi:hypothetical protein